MTHGITHLTTPPHTHEQNGYSESRHRHTVETGLTFLHQVTIPLTFWPYAFATVVYLINRMPKVGLSLGSYFEKLFNKAPDPSKLRVFGCLCFPWLHPYSSYKLDPKSSPCVFLGYSLTQSAFLCCDPTLKKKKSLCRSCQVCGKCIPVCESLYLHHIGNKHRLCTLCFIVHLMRLSSSAPFPLPILPTLSELLCSSPSPHLSSCQIASPLPIPPTSPKLLSLLQSPHPSSRRLVSLLPILLTSPELLR